MFCAATALVAFAPIFAACVRSRGRPCARRWPARGDALLVGGAGVEVLLPAHVVDVDLTADGVENHTRLTTSASRSTSWLMILEPAGVV